VANPYILAKTMKDAHAFARDFLDLRPGRYRVVTSSSSISGPRGADLYLVPGWDERYDKFAVKGALRYTRLNVIDASELEAKAPEVPDNLVPPGVQLTIVDDASAFFDNVTNGSDMIAEGSPVAPEADRVDILQAMSDEVAKVEEKTEQTEIPLVEEPPAEAPKKRRRSRCKDCNTLHYKDESCPEAE